MAWSSGLPSRGAPLALEIDGLLNTRDLGGWRRSDGSRTPTGVFARSENLDAVTERGWEQLYDHGIRTVVDLRQPSERARYPYTAPEWVTVAQVDHDGLDEHPEFWAGYWDNGLMGTPLYYLPHLRTLPHRTAAVLRAVACAPEGGVLFHCMSGRDRTGLVAMVLHLLARTEPDDVVADYLVSAQNSAAMAAARGRPDEEDARAEVCRQRGTTAEEALREAVAGADLKALLALLDPDERTAVATWRGALA